MEYFILSQKGNIPNTVEVRIKANAPNEPKSELLKEQTDQIKAVTRIPVTSDVNNFYPDVIDGPVFIVSDQIKKLIEIYDDSPVWKCVALLDHVLKKQSIYWLPLLDKIDCVSDETEFYKDKSLKKLVLDKEKIGNSKIFRVASISRKLVVVNLDIAESILRRFFQGIKLEKVDCVGGNEIWRM